MSYVPPKAPTTPTLKVLLGNSVFVIKSVLVIAIRSVLSVVFTLIEILF